MLTRLILIFQIAYVCCGNGPHLAILTHRDVIAQRLEINKYIASLSSDIEKPDPLSLSSDGITGFLTKIITQLSDYQPIKLISGKEETEEQSYAILNLPLLAKKKFIATYSIKFSNSDCILKLNYMSLQIHFNLKSDKTDISFDKGLKTDFETSCSPSTIDQNALKTAINKNLEAILANLVINLNTLLTQKQPFKPNFIPDFSYTVFNSQHSLINSFTSNPVLFSEESDYVISYFNGKPKNTEETEINIDDFKDFDLTNGDQIQMYYQIELIKNNIEYISSNGLYFSTFFKPKKAYDLNLTLCVEDLGRFIPGIYYQYLRQQIIIISQILKYVDIFYEPKPDKPDEYNMYALTCFRLKLYQANTETQIIEIGFYIKFNVEFRIEDCINSSQKSTCLSAYIGNKLRLDKIYVNKKDYVINVIELQNLFYSKIVNFYKLLTDPIYIVDFTYPISYYSIRKGGFMVGLLRKPKATQKAEVISNDGDL